MPALPVRLRPILDPAENLEVLNYKGRMDSTKVLILYRYEKLRVQPLETRTTNMLNSQSIRLELYCKIDVRYVTKICSLRT